MKITIPKNITLETEMKPPEDKIWHQELKIRDPEDIEININGQIFSIPKQEYNLSSSGELIRMVSLLWETLLAQDKKIQELEKMIKGVLLD